MAIQTSFVTLPKSTKVELRYHSNPAASNQSHAVLLLPFWGGSASTYDAVLDLFSNNKSAQLGTAVALSYPGTGNSPQPETDTAEFHAIESRAELATSIIQSQEFAKLVKPVKKLVLVAHSFSAKIAYEVLSLLSQTPGAEITVSSLVLLGPAPPTAFELPPEVREFSKTAYDNVENATFAVENVLTENTPAAEVVRRLANGCVNMSPGAKQGWPQLGMQYDCTNALAKMLKALPNFKILVLIGQHDKVETVENVERDTVNVLRTSGFAVQSQIIEGCGHLIPVEKPQAVVDAVLNVSE